MAQTTINQRVKSVRKSLSLDQTAFAEYLGYKQGTISMIENASANVTDDFIELLIDKLKVRRDYIKTGNEPIFSESIKSIKTMLIPDRVEEPRPQYNAKPLAVDGDEKNMYLVPLKAYGGFLNGYGDKIFMEENLQKIANPRIKGEVFSFEVEGFSMCKPVKVDGVTYYIGYPPNSWVNCTKLENPDWMVRGKDYVFQTIDGIILKTFAKKDDKACHLTCYNEDYMPVDDLRLRSIKVIYQVVEKSEKVN